jgi:hypothetical protein
MKYAIFLPADQTIEYWTGSEPTINHKEAFLYSSKEEVQSVVDNIHVIYGISLHPRDGLPWATIEEVEDEEEFRSREDTW